MKKISYILGILGVISIIISILIIMNQNNNFNKNSIDSKSKEYQETEIPAYFSIGNPENNLTTKDYASLGKDVLIGIYDDESKGVCIIRSNVLHCFKYKNYDVEKVHLQKVFSDINCNINDQDASCIAGDFICSFTSSGHVYCSGPSPSYDNCRITSMGSIICSSK